MSEFQDQRDDDVEDEVEAHKKASSLADDGDGDDAEVEGHKKASSLSEDDDPEVEGHVKRGA